MYFEHKNVETEPSILHKLAIFFKHHMTLKKILKIGVYEK